MQCFQMFCAKVHLPEVNVAKANGNYVSEIRELGIRRSEN